MIVVIFQGLIISIAAMLQGMQALSVVIKGSDAGLLDENGTEIECVYTREQISQVFSVSFMAFNRSSTSVDQIATYIPGKTPKYPPPGEYLKGRVTLTSITQNSTKAVMTFNKLMCIDETIYSCKVNYMDLSSNILIEISNNKNISVQVPPSKPDSISIVKTPADNFMTSSKYTEESTSSPSNASKENEILSDLQNVTPNDNSFNYSSLQKTDHSSTPSPDDESSNSSYKTTTYSIQQTTPAPGIVEGDNITVLCTGDVGKPPAEYIFQKYHSGHILSMNYTATETNISEIAENCSYYRTSSFTFQVTAKDNNASIRCAVNSSMPEFDKLYKETAPIEVNYEVRMPNITKYPNKVYYVVGKDSSIHLTCKSDGNPKPAYFWYKENPDNHISDSDNLTIKVMNKTDSEDYTCSVSNTVNGQLYTNSTTVKIDVRNEADTSTLPSSSTGTSSGTGEKHGNQKKELTLVFIGSAAGVVFVLLVLLGCYLLKRNRNRKDEYTENNGSTNNLVHYSSKHGVESRPGAYESVVLDDALVMSSGKNEQNVEEFRKLNEEYMKNQTNEEKHESKSPTSDQPVIYAEVNKEKKIKNRQETSNQQDDDTYAGTQEGIYDQSGNSRHKVNENAEQFDKIKDIREQISTDDAASLVKSNQKGSYVNQALNKGEKQVATVPPISRSSAGSQGYEQTSELSQKEYENVKGTDNTHTSTGQSINQTSFQT